MSEAGERPVHYNSAASVPTTPPTGGPPLRALAMVLIALAIVFGGLGALSFSKSDSGSSGSAAATPSAAAANTPAASSAAPATSTSNVPAAVDKSIPVRVFNNSQVQGLARTTADQLTATGWTIAETGNYAEENIPKTTVYYGNSASEKAAAQEVATELSATAEPRFAGIANLPAGVIVIVTGE